MALVYAQSFDIPTSGWDSNTFPLLPLTIIKKRAVPIQRPHDNFYTEEGVYSYPSEPFTISPKTIAYPSARLYAIPESTPWGDNNAFDSVSSFRSDYVFEEVVPILFHEQNQNFFTNESVQEFSIAKLVTYSPPRILTAHMVEMDLLENMTFWGVLLTDREYLAVLESPYIHVGTKINRTIYPRSMISTRGKSQKSFW